MDAFFCIKVIEKKVLRKKKKKQAQNFPIGCLTKSLVSCILLLGLTYCIAMWVELCPPNIPMVKS